MPHSEQSLGQQQLLLLALGIVIVFLTVVVGIQAGEKNKDQHNVDQMVEDATHIALDAQAWKRQSSVFGDGESVGGWTGLDFEKLGYTVGEVGVHPGIDAQNYQYENRNGIYSINSSGTILIITGNSYSYDGDLWNTIFVRVKGVTPADIEVDCTFRYGSKTTC